MTQCPKCKSENIHRSRPRARWEKWRKKITGKRPFRCHECGWRGWDIDRGPKFGDEAADLAARVLAPVPPNLKGTALARDEQPASVNLEQLDTFDDPVNKRN
jgi:DNA-directed RNA polymerase subunit RPC12/RpoP